MPLWLHVTAINRTMNEENTSINIRMAKPGDERAISALLYSAFQVHERLYTRQGFSATTLSVPDVMLRIEDKVMWVATYSDEIVGTISVVPNDDGFFIKSVAVSPDARRQGLGAKLIAHAEQLALKQGARFLELTTTSFLVDAGRLYKKLGFRQSGYSDLFGTRLIKMRKRLIPGASSVIETTVSDH